MAIRLTYVTLCVALCFTCLCQSQSGNRLSMTSLDRGPLQSESSIDGNNQYQCFVSHRNGNEVVESYRLGYTRDGAANNPDPPDAGDVTGNPYKRWLVDLDVTNNNAFGVFGCEASRNGELATKVSTVRMRSDAKITPRNSLYTQTVSIGDESIQIEMSVSPTEDLQWMKDNKILLSANRTGTYRLNQPIKQSDAGIYECFVDGERNDALHGLILLLVRACRARRFGPPDCLGICDNCYNGGVCDEANGECICPPGFRGTNCEIGCGFNRYGEDCEFQCSSRDDNGDRCRGNLYCRPHPFGCTCISGFKGLSCQDDCPPGSYGASCLQTCHCASGGTCARETGICTAGCDNGWSGTNCQVPDICPEDFYGMTCTEKCHCKDAARCDKLNGACLNGICAPGYEVSANDYCEECQGNFFGLYCSNDCHCAENSCNKITGSCSGECTDQWVDRFSPYNCQTGLISAKFTTVNPGVSVPVHCTAFEGPGGNLSTLQLVLSRDDTNLDNTRIYFHNTTENDDTSTSTFTVDNVNVGEVLYCQLRYEDGNEAVISVNVTYFYRLPELAESPTEVSSNSSSVTIAWTTWNENDDVGDGPVIGYIPYYKLPGGDWTPGNFVSEMATSFTFTGLNSETRYFFGVAAVRPGQQGEGPRSPELQVKTVCGVPKAVPLNLTAEVAGQHQENVYISWQIPENEILCTTGVDSLTIYYASTNLKEDDRGAETIEDPYSTIFILTGLQIDGNYSIHMTLETSGGESDSSCKIHHYIPRIPLYQEAPTILLRGTNSLNVSWVTWDGVHGTPPVVEYKLYTKLSNSTLWTDGFISVPATDTQEVYYVEVTGLQSDTEYDFRVAAVREGPNGDGPPGPTLQRTKTNCHDPSIGSKLPTDVQAFVVGDRQELMNITWQLLDDSIDCSTGVDYFTVYYSETSVQTTTGESRWILIYHLDEGHSYSFIVTFSTSGGESQKSQPSEEVILPVLPALHDSLRTLNSTCDALDVEWDTWNESTDPGTPPIVSYIPYYKISSSGNWTRGETVPHDKGKTKHSYTFRNLSKNNRFKFAIAVVREGYGGEGTKREVDDTRTCLTKGSNIGVIVGVSIGSVIVAVITVFLIYWNRKAFSCLSEVSETSANVTDERVVKDFNNDAFSGYENANDTEYSTVVEKHESCGFTEQSNTNKEYEEPSSDKPELIQEATSETGGINLRERKAAMYQNSTTDGSHTSRLPMKSSKFLIFMKGGLSRQKILADSKLLDELIPWPDLATLFGSSDVNLPKNRFANIIPLDENRPLLRSMCVTQGGNDYINASFVKIPGVTQTLIMAQAPLQNTTEDFWRLVYDYNCRSIVMLNDTFSEDQTSVRYWPDFDDVIFGTMKVSTVSIEKKENYTIHQCKVLHQSFKEFLNVNRFVFNTWPKKDENLSSLVDFISVVRFGSVENGVVLIHCTNGADRSGVYAVVGAEINRSDKSQTVNVYDTIKSVKLSNPSALRKKEDYLLCYQLLNCYLTDNDDYATID